MKKCFETGSQALILSAAALTCTAVMAGTPQLAVDPMFEPGAGGKGAIAGSGSCTHAWDDGTATTSLGYTAATNATWGNRFMSRAGCDVIDTVHVAFGTIPAGTAITVYVLSDPNQDGNPSDAATLATAAGVTANVNTDTFNAYALTTPVTVSGSYFIAVRLSQPAGQFPMRYDATLTDGQSFTRAGTDAANPFQDDAATAGVGAINNMRDINFDGDFMVRATGPASDCPASNPIATCAEDHTPPAETASGTNGDGTVNVQDLLATIGMWGGSGAGPRPRADVRPLPNGDCVVNVQDLLGVIGKWGPCPAAPANNACANGSAIGNGLTLFNNRNATVDGPSPACGGATPSADVWFNYTATCLGRVNVNTEGSYPVDDTIVEIYDGCSGTLLACDDDSGTGFLSNVNYEASPGQALKIRVTSWGATGRTGAGRLNVSCNIHNSDVCTDAQPIAIGGEINDDIGGTNAETNPLECALNGVGRWYVVQGDGNTLTATLCNSPAQGKTLWDPIMSVYCSNLADECGTLSCVASADDDTCGPLGVYETLSFCTTVGENYYILVGADSSSVPPAGQGLIKLEVDTNSVGCTPSVSQCGDPPPSNDECSGAVEIFLGTNEDPDPNTLPNNYNNTLATTSAGIPGGACGGSADALRRDVWFKFTPTVSGVYTFSLCNTAVTAWDSMISLLRSSNNTCGGTLEEKACNDDGCAAGGFSFATSTSTPAGQTIFVRVGGWTPAGGPDSASGAGQIRIVVSQEASVCGNGILEAGEQCEGSTVACSNCELANLAALPDSSCVLSPEACLVDTNCDSTNGGPVASAAGANECVTACNFDFYDEGAGTGTISLNTPYRGTSSSYVNAGVNRRDGDHLQFIAPAAGRYRLYVNANFTGAGNFMTAAASECGGAIAFVEGTAPWANNSNYQVPMSATVLDFLAGEKHAIRLRPAAATGMACPGPNQWTIYIVKEGVQ